MNDIDDREPSGARKGGTYVLTPEQATGRVPPEALPQPEPEKPLAPAPAEVIEPAMPEVSDATDQP